MLYRTAQFVPKSSQSYTDRKDKLRCFSVADEVVQSCSSFSSVRRKEFLSELQWRGFHCHTENQLRFIPLYFQRAQESILSIMTGRAGCNDSEETSSSLQCSSSSPHLCQRPDNSWIGLFFLSFYFFYFWGASQKIKKLLKASLTRVHNSPFSCLWARNCMKLIIQVNNCPQLEFSTWSEHLKLLLIVCFCLFVLFLSIGDAELIIECILSEIWQKKKSESF